MAFYVTEKAGSIMFRRPRTIKVLAKFPVPDEAWQAADQAARKELLDQGMVVEAVDPDELPAPEPERLPTVGVGQSKFSPKAVVQRGERFDAKLEELKRQQAAQAAQAKAESEVDPERGGSADGVVRVETPDDEDEDVEGEWDEDLTDEERAAIAEMDDEDEDN